MASSDGKNHGRFPGAAAAVVGSTTWRLRPLSGRRRTTRRLSRPNTPTMSFSSATGTCNAPTRPRYGPRMPSNCISLTWNACSMMLTGPPSFTLRVAASPASTVRPSAAKVSVTRLTASSDAPNREPSSVDVSVACGRASTAGNGALRASLRVTSTHASASAARVAVAPKAGVRSLPGTAMNLDSVMVKLNQLRAGETSLGRGRLH